jgi:hypothetical protein
MSEPSQSILLELFSEDADPAETERLTHALRRELLDLREVDDVSPASAGPPPPGARGVDLAALGALVVSVKPTVDLLVKLVGVVQDWLGRHKDPGAQTMRVTINGQSLELTPTKGQQERIVRQFLEAATAH